MSDTWDWFKAKDTIEEFWIKTEGKRYLEEEARVSCDFCGKIKTDLVGINGKNVNKGVCKSCLNKLLTLRKEMELGIHKFRYFNYATNYADLKVRLPTKKELEEREEFEGER